jgi:hypothetical protein
MNSNKCVSRSILTNNISFNYKKLDKKQKPVKCLIKLFILISLEQIDISLEKSLKGFLFHLNFNLKFYNK